MVPVFRSVVRVAFLALVVAGCTTTEIVYRDREPFNPPVDAASGLLGYYTASSKQTSCGNCHVGHQTRWKETAHASAHKTLTDINTDPTRTCWGCHATTERGNKLTLAAGYNVNADSAYNDVQCESCHGPGTAHVQNPSNKANTPLARLSMSVTGESCAACHTGSHHGFADEWAQSGHAQVATTSTCGNACHNARGVLVAWGVNTTNYVERDSTELMPTTCAVCHDPHGSPNPAQLRFPVATADPEVNLCMKCHMRKGEPGTGGRGGSPHAPQGFVVLGTGGYRPPGVSIDPNISLTTHASDANPRLCAGCHVNRYTITDPTSGSFVFSSTGHLFKAIPCLNTAGVPIADGSCAYTPPERSFKSCIGSGCHASEAIAAGRLTLARSEIETLAAQIWTDLDGDETIDAFPTDGGYLALIKRDNPGQLGHATIVTPAMGAEFNVRTFAEHRYGNGDRSKGVHNPFLARALLGASVNELRTAYGLPAPPASISVLVEKSLQAAAQRAPAFISAAHRAE